MNYSEKWRYASVGVPTQLKHAALAMMEREVAEFGKHSFFRIDESVHLTDPRERSSTGASLFSDVDFLNYLTRADKVQAREEVLAELKWVVKRLEDGTPFDTPIEPIWMIKGGVSFWMTPENGQNGSNSEESHSREILAYRARLIRLLRWPHQYHSVVRSLARFREQVQDMNLAAFSPYDVVAELEAYLDDMRRHYPVLEVQSLDGSSTP